MYCNSFVKFEENFAKMISLNVKTCKITFETFINYI